MAKAEEILDLANPEDDFLKDICDSIRPRIENNDSRYFKFTVENNKAHLKGAILSMFSLESKHGLTRAIL